jgi:hypothetical protein
MKAILEQFREYKDEVKQLKHIVKNFEIANTSYLYEYFEELYKELKGKNSKIDRQLLFLLSILPKEISSS